MFHVRLVLVIAALGAGISSAPAQRARVELEGALREGIEPSDAVGKILDAALVAGLTATRLGSFDADAAETVFIRTSVDTASGFFEVSRARAVTARACLNCASSEEYGAFIAVIDEAVRLTHDPRVLDGTLYFRHRDTARLAATLTRAGEAARAFARSTLPPEASPALRDALTFVQQGFPHLALQRIDAAPDPGPLRDLARAWAGLAVGEAAAAEAAGRAWLGDHAGSPEGAALLAIALRALDRPAEAAAAARPVPALRPLVMLLRLEMRGEWPSAPVVDRLATLADFLPEADAALAALLRSADPPADPEPILDRLVARFPESPSLRILRGALRHDRGDFRAAREDLDLVRDFHGGDPVFGLVHAETLLRTGDPGRAALALGRSGSLPRARSLAGLLADPPEATAPASGDVPAGFSRRDPAPEEPILPLQRLVSDDGDFEALAGHVRQLPGIRRLSPADIDIVTAAELMGRALLGSPALRVQAERATRAGLEGALLVLAPSRTLGNRGPTLAFLAWTPAGLAVVVLQAKDGTVGTDRALAAIDRLLVPLR